MTDQITISQQATAVPGGIIATVTVTKLARAAFYVLLTAIVAYQFELAYGLPPRSTQLLVTIASFAGLLRPLLGYWGDVRPLGKHRRKNMLTLGNILYLAAISLLLSFPNPMLGTGYVVVLVAFVAYGIGESCIDVATDALLLDIATTTAEKNRAQGFARLGAVAGTLVAYGTAIALVGPGYPWLLAIIALAIIAGTALTFRIREPPITREQVLDQIAREQPAIPASYKKTIWIAGIAFALTPLAEGMYNVQFEPWLIAKYGSIPDIFYAAELAAAAIGIAVLIAIMAAQRRKPWNSSVLIIPAGLAGAVLVAGLPWLAPTIDAYMAWNAAKVTAGVFAVLGMERAFMDVVKGARKGATFQVFVLFMMAGSTGGQFLGSAIAGIGMEALLVIAGCIIAGAVAMYALVLAPRLKEA